MSCRNEAGAFSLSDDDGLLSLIDAMSALAIRMVGVYKMVVRSA